MDAPAKPIVRPERLAAELARASDSVRIALLSAENNSADISPLIGCFDAPLGEALNAQLKFPIAEGVGPAAQLIAFGLLLAAHDGRLASVAKKLGTSHPAWELIETLSGADLGAVLEQLHRESAAVEPLAQFHELYLRACDHRLRRQHGVFYTPRPIVDWILRAVDSCMDRCFSDASLVRTIDPACGSGAFLSEVIARREQLFGRRRSISVVGFELLPATKAVAETLLHRQLGQCSEQALRVECVNPLTKGEALAPRVLGNDNALPVILGNPPYANFGRQNKGAWITTLLRDYKTGLRERKLNLDDDFIKFLRWGQYWVERAGRGVLAMITSRTYLDGLTHRVMRRSLAHAFDEIYVLDLGGDADARRHAASRAEDENVFGIRRGVAIGLFVRSGRGGTTRVRYHRLRGARDEKFAALRQSDLSSMPWRTLALSDPQHHFTPRRRPSGEYHTWPRLDEVFGRYISGVQTKNDALLTDFRRETLAARMQALLGGENAETPANDRRRALVESARAKLGDRLNGVAYDEQCLQPYLVAPFDRRWIYYEPRLVGRARLATMRHLLYANIALVFMRQSKCEGEYDHFLATDTLASDRVFYSTHGAPFVAPLWLYEDSASGDVGAEAARTPNLQRAFADDFARRLGTVYATTHPPARESSDAIGPADIFHYAYAAFHSTDYRRRFDDELRVDFPRIPLPQGRLQFDRRRDLGRQLVRVHLAGAHCSGAFHTPQESLAPRLDQLPRDVRDWRVGGYAVLSRWLRQRRGLLCGPDDQSAFAHLVATVAQSVRLIREIDALREGDSKK